MDDDLDQADAVAFVLAHLSGNEQLVNALLDQFEVRDLFACTVGLLLLLLNQAGIDEAALDETLRDWQKRRRSSLLD